MHVFHALHASWHLSTLSGESWTWSWISGLYMLYMLHVMLSDTLNQIFLTLELKHSLVYLAGRSPLPRKPPKMVSLKHRNWSIPNLYISLSIIVFFLFKFIWVLYLLVTVFHFIHVMYNKCCLKYKNIRFIHVILSYLRYIYTFYWLRKKIYNFNLVLSSLNFSETFLLKK